MGNFIIVNEKDRTNANNLKEYNGIDHRTTQIR